MLSPVHALTSRTMTCHFRATGRSRFGGTGCHCSRQSARRTLPPLGCFCSRRAAVDGPGPEQGRCRCYGGIGSRQLSILCPSCAPRALFALTSTDAVAVAPVNAALIALGKRHCPASHCRAPGAWWRVVPKETPLCAPSTRESTLTQTQLEGNLAQRGVRRLQSVVCGGSSETTRT